MFLRQDARIQDLYFNIYEIKQSITLLFSVKIMSYSGASDIIYSDMIDSFISEILKYKSWILAQKILDREIHTTQITSHSITTM